ncbi:MAG: cobyric acid synthase [Pseudomonadota bacterium]
MFQGTGSNVGKSLIVAGFCRALHNRGYNVAPFKPQNMSNNAAVSDDGGEIGRAQALQALACHRTTTVHMNPVLLKPETETGSQIIVQGKVFGKMRAKEYGTKKSQLLPYILESFEALSKQADYIVVEGAGSPAETNLRAGDIANMGFAEATNLPVILTGDIDRGGVIAQIVGTKSVISENDAKHIKGFIINKFRGNPDLFTEGYKEIETQTDWPGFGIIPWFPEANQLPAEDALDISSSKTGDFHIAVPILSRIANFDDLDPLKSEPSVKVTLVPAGKALPADANLIIIPGTKSSISDLEFFYNQGWDIDLKAHIRRGGHVLGICGGYQILGKSIHDPYGIEGQIQSINGLGLLDVETIMTPQKTVQRIEATHINTQIPVTAYEIHMGETSGPDCQRPLFSIAQRQEGARSKQGNIMGTYLHGCFQSDSFRAKFLQQFGQKSCINYAQNVEHILENLAAHLETHMDIDAALKIC